MRAILYTEYGPPNVLQLKEVEKPTPKDNEILVKVYASSVNQGDAYVVRGEPLLFRPSYGLPGLKHTIPGGDVAGELKRLAKTQRSFSRVTRYSEISASVVLALGPSMYPLLKMQWT